MEHPPDRVAALGALVQLTHEYDRGQSLHESPRDRFFMRCRLFQDAEVRKAVRRVMRRTNWGLHSLVSLCQAVAQSAGHDRDHFHGHEAAVGEEMVRWLRSGCDQPEANALVFAHNTKDEHKVSVFFFSDPAKRSWYLGMRPPTHPLHNITLVWVVQHLFV